MCHAGSYDAAGCVSVASWDRVIVGSLCWSSPPAWHRWRWLPLSCFRSDGRSEQDHHHKCESVHATAPHRPISQTTESQTSKSRFIFTVKRYSDDQWLVLLLGDSQLVFCAIATTRW